MMKLFNRLIDFLIALAPLSPFMPSGATENFVRE
jgi:hypothetical protein